jgi:maleylpyruvate isomerase
LELKGLAYEYRPIHLLQDGGQQNAPDYQAKNPVRTVPLLELTEGGRTHRIAQSLAIIAFLDERHPSPPLLPEEPFARAKVRELAELINSGIQPLQNLAVLQHVKRTLEADEKAWAQHWVGRGMDALETLVAQSAGRYCVGDEVTLADLCLVPQVFSARRFGVDLTRCPTVVRVEEALSQLPAFQRAHADHQPDAQPA